MVRERRIWIEDVVVVVVVKVELGRRQKEHRL